MKRYAVVGIVLFLCAAACVAGERYDYGTVRWGMTEAEVVKATGAKKILPIQMLFRRLLWRGYDVIEAYAFKDGLLSRIHIMVPSQAVSEVKAACTTLDASRSRYEIRAAEIFDPHSTLNEVGSAAERKAFVDFCSGFRGLVVDVKLEARIDLEPIRKRVFGKPTF